MRQGVAIYLEGPFVLNIDPAFAEVWGVNLSYHGLAYALGFFALFLWVMLRRSYLGLSSRQAWDLSLIFSLSCLVVGRAFQILIYEWELFRGNYPEMLAFWKGGIAYDGVIIGCLVGVLLFCLIDRKRFLLVADEIVIPVAFLLALARIGNHLNGEVYGYVTGAWWGVKFPYAEGFRHPIALYEAFKDLLIVLIVLAAARTAVPGQGRLLGHFMFWYGLFDFIIDVFQRPGPVLGEIGADHLCNALVAVVGLLLIARSARKDSKRKTGLNTLHFAPASLVATIPSGLNPAIWFRIILFLVVLLFCLTIPSGWSQEWLYRLASQQGI
ncbi:MAG: prolipoprotein diacylglyceryl transferase [Syntrophorhabdaceae bacterium]|nr:prolipoprotein diacylglyceryl transferase [Syntrophorhabdaceae bacterium]